MSPGEQKLDFVYADDVINAYQVALKRLVKSETCQHEKFGVCSNKPISLKQLVASLERIFDIHLSINWGGRAYRKREVMIPPNLTPLPSWTPRIDLEQGLNKIRIAY